LLVAYTLVGAWIGYRSYALTGVVMLATLMTSGTKRIKVSRVVAVVVLVAGITVLGVSTGLVRRSVGSDVGASGRVSGTAGFLSRRVGGLEYLAPVVGQVEVEGVDRQRLRPATWDNFLLTHVYRLPAGAHTAFAGTAIGWLYAGGGLLLVVVGGVAAAIGTHLGDTLQHRSGDLRARVIHAVLALAWVNFFLEGTPRASILIACYGVLLCYVLLGRPRLSVPTLAAR
jgi:hypothetical protein